MNSIAKIFSGLLLNRLQEWTERNRVLKEFQGGFRKGYGTVDLIFSLCCIAELTRKKLRKRLYAVFVDFAAAFDSIDRRSLWYKLHMYGVSSGFILMLKNLYDETCACLWGEHATSEVFLTEAGLRQGCLLSPLLFSLFLNDLEDELGKGCIMAGMLIKLLAYADDCTILATDASTLQNMISDLERYCATWNLKINWNKTKIMIFGDGRRKKGTEEWKNSSGEPIEVVSKFKYLGIWLSPKMTFEANFIDKLRAAKLAINSTWRSILVKQEVDLEEKRKIFDATAKAIVLYGAQVWGFRSSEAVEKIQRFFIRKVLRLPLCTPNYALYLETGWCTMFSRSLALHFNYLCKILSMPDTRLPKLLYKEIVKCNIFCFREIKEIAAKHRLQWKGDDVEAMKSTGEKLVQAIEFNYKDRMVKQANEARWHVLYSKLQHPGEYLSSRNISMKQKQTIARARCEELSLNFKPWRNDQEHQCSMCNLNTNEDILHFLGVCPVLKEFRMRFFKKTVLTEEECINILNGQNWSTLLDYMKTAGGYRNFLIAQYN